MRYILLRTSSQQRLLVVAFAERPPRTRLISARQATRSERGVTAARYREGSNVIVVDPDLVDVFPDGESVNEALRALAQVIRARQGKHSA